MSIHEKLERLTELKAEIVKQINQDENERVQTLLEEQRTLRSELFAAPDAWTRVQIARFAKRPNAAYFIQAMFTDLLELHGDRQSGDDPSMYCALGRFLGMPVTIIAQRKGSNLQENLACNFGMNSPEGYRKALRLMKQAEKFGRPILTFVDTPGAYPGISAEEKGQGEAIARNLMEMSQLKVPIITFVLGEGGSGGALALSICDKMIMLEHAVYSILSPEGFASILYKDSSKAQEAASLMKMTSTDLLHNGFVDIVVDEPEEGIHIAPEKVVAAFTQHLREQLINLRKLRVDVLLSNRYNRYRKFGEALK
jgi:acetyl-CoA carboxylase carboxyl transferase subunit alpha